jgi:beta-glucanase (GH16 family)
VIRVAVYLAVLGAALAAAHADGAAPPRVPMPVGNLVGWRQVFADDFTNGFDTSRWSAYSGQPGGDPGGWWEPSHVTVQGGVLHLTTYRDPRYGNRWVSGGVSSSVGLKQTYGKYAVRFRADRGKGVAVILLLWPVRDHWPPEIDFAENGGTDDTRSELAATLHFGADNQIIQRTVHGDFTRWHTLGVEWTPGRLVYRLDGKVWARVLSQNVPDEPMELDIQAQAGTCGDEYAPCPDATTPRRVDLAVDWVVAYAFRGPLS